MIFKAVFKVTSVMPQPPVHILVLSEFFNSLPDDKILDWSKLKVFADKINGSKKLKFVLRRMENIVGKGENAGYQTCFTTH